MLFPALEVLAFLDLDDLDFAIALLLSLLLIWSIV
jgi:hypothetical protein